MNRHGKSLVRLGSRLMATLLEVRDLDVSYGSRTAGAFTTLAGATFSIGPGEILGVLGESGSGKSTLAASLLRLLPRGGFIGRGQILLNGDDIVKMGARELRQVRGKRISFIPQEPSLALHPTMRVGDQVGEVLRAHETGGVKGQRKRVREVLRSVFPEDAERIAACYPHQLSGGQRQRVLIAQAIACKPALLVADEPTASLDPSTQSEIISLFRQLRKDLGVAILFITHNPALLADFADRVLVLYAGKIIEMGPASGVLFAGQHPYTRALLGCVPVFDPADFGANKSALPVIPGAAPEPGRRLRGCVYEPRCSDRMEACQTREPATVAVSETHRAACLKLGE
jgi:peptide/nickel transport system ATP-binding protein